MNIRTRVALIIVILLLAVIAFYLIGQAMV